MRFPERSFDDPRDRPMPRCPFCDAEVNDFYVDFDGRVCGCERCCRMVDAWEPGEEWEDWIHV